MAWWKKNENNKGLRPIMTARDEASINKGVKGGFWPLVKKVERSPEIRSNFMVVQNKKTGEIEVVGDQRMGFDTENYDMVIEWTYYYPHCFASPFAAYLIPPDIEIGERVYIEDLIEDIVGARWNQGNNYRLEGCEAIWNGKDLEIQYDPDTNLVEFEG